MKRRPAPDSPDLQLSLPLLYGDTSAGTRTEPAATPVSAGPAAPAPVAAAALVPAAPVAPRPTGLLRHPRGNREISLGGQAIAYELKRARRRTIGFVIGTEGLAVSAPRWVGQPEIDAALASKERWILRKLADQGERRQQVEAARLEWRDGTRLPFLGGTLVLVLDPGVRGVLLHEPAATPPAHTDAIAEPPERRLHIGLPLQADAAQIREGVQRWLQRQALQLFEARCGHYAPQLGVQVRRLRLSSAQTRWGSASADGTVRLNWRLIHFGLASIDYVVVHELAHLREMNHSPAFWAVVHSVMPDYQSRRGTLKDGPVPVFD